MYRILFIASIVFAGCSVDKQNPDLARLESRAENVEIIRDDFGVPHIYGKSDADAVFGLIYAQCEDDFARVERNYVWAIGRLAEIEGEEMIYSDLRARLFMTKEEAIAAYESAPAWLQELCQAFADGANYYLQTNPQVKPRLLTRFEPWMPMYFTEGSIGGDIERVSTRKIAEFYSEQELLAEIPAEQSIFPPEPKGSNGIAIAGKLTESGNAMLLINPHTSFYFRPEVHVVSEEGLNAYGAVTWGQFFVYQGFNEKTGWMHTSTYTDVIDEFVEEVTETPTGFTYTYGDEQRPVETLEVSLNYITDAGMKSMTFPMYRTHHGPVTHYTDGKWTSTALMWEPVKALEQSYTRTKKSGLEEFEQMMDIRTNSSNNTVYADAEGNIAYYHGNFIPKRDSQFNYRRPVDGSNPATDWQGLHTVDESIKVINPPTGWIQNCNSTPFTSAAEYSPKVEDYPVYMSRNQENFRGVHAIRLLKEASNLTLDGLIDLAYDPKLPAFEVLIPGVIEAFDKSGQPADLKEAVEELRSWDFTVSKESVAMSIAHFYASLYLQEGIRPEGLNFMQRIEYFGTESPENERLEILSQTLAKLDENYGTWRTPWGDINRFQRLNGDIVMKFDDSKPSIPVGMASGNWGALAAYGMRGNHPNVKKLYGSRGNSFVAVVEFGDKVRAKSLLAGGQSGDPTSPHFYDQAQRYADGEFKDVAFYREDVEARAERVYKPGN